MAGSAQATQQVQTVMLNSQERARCADLFRQATPAQQKILRQISTGLAPRDIAIRQSISPETVYSHTKALLSLARNTWCIPSEEKIDFHFLFLKFGGYFDGTE